MVVDQLAEWLPPRQEICSSNPVISNFLYKQVLKFTIEKTKIKKKWMGKAHFKKNNADSIAQNTKAKMQKRPRLAPFREK